MRFKLVFVIILFSYSNGFSQNSNLIDSLINNSIKYIVPEDKKEKKNIIINILHIDFLSGIEIENLPFLPIL